ncbi:MAG: site-2 protease family protein [Planctomycetota bacterium]
MLHGLAVESFLVQAALPSWASNAWSFLLLLLGFSLVIFVHELGHFLAAKWAGVRVDKFAIGFGKELFGFTKGETRYSFNALPLGGYVKMLGQEDFVVDKSGELKVKNDPDAFTNKPIGKRMVIISAGVVMNLLFAAVAFAVVVMVGRPQAPAVIGVVVPNSPAARAGLQTGDTILKINGDEIDSFQDLTSTIILSDPEEPLIMDVERDGKPVLPKLEVNPEFQKDVRLRRIGIASGQNLRVVLPSIRLEEERLPDELQKDDAIYKLILPSGEAKRFKDKGVFRRAIQGARGAPIELVVKRPKNPDALTAEMLMQADPDIETTEVRVQCQALWTPWAYDEQDAVSGSLLGLVPRLTITLMEEGKSFQKAGARSGDVLVRLGSAFSPTFDEVKQTIEENPDKQVEMAVRRRREENHGLAARTVECCVVHRETLIAAAREDTAKALAKAVELATSAGLPDGEVETLRKKLEALGGAKEWRQWLESVDVHELELVPKTPFALFSKTVPKVDTAMQCLDEDHLVVADIRDTLGDVGSPAKKAGIPRLSVILSAAGKPVSQWWELSEVFRQSAGRTIPLTYRVVDEVVTTKITVPQCVSATLGLPQGTRIVQINGEHTRQITRPEGKQITVALPDWRAVAAILKEHIGETVKIEYVTAEAERKQADYAVTADNTDPWLHRVQFSEGFACYPLFERHPVRNPILAVGVGFKQAYQTTMQTIQTIRHLIITRQVGFSNVSGPVGIFRIGSEAAGSGVIYLLFFLALLSANLAVINFLPLPIVDGGLFLFLLLEKIRGEPVSIKTQVATQIVGIALIAAVFLLVTYQDIKNWIVGT